MKHRRAVAAAVVTLIAVVATGCASRGAQAPTPGQSEQAAGRPVGVVLRDFEFEPRPLRTKAGPVQFLLMNRGSVDHDFAIPALEGHNAHEQHVVRPWKNRTVELELKPGTYEAICTVPGHREAGMVVTIEVSL